MNDEAKTRDQLLNELSDLRQRLSELMALFARFGGTERSLPDTCRGVPKISPEDMKVPGQTLQANQVLSVIEEEKRDEEEQATGKAAELARTNRALRMVIECNEVMVRATSTADLMHALCRIIVDAGGYAMAWIGMKEYDEAKTVRPLAYAGHNAGYLDTLHVTWADTPRGHGPTGMAIRTGRLSVQKHIADAPEFSPWRAEAVARGYESSISLPLLSEGTAIGALNIYASRTDAFDLREQLLLSEVADNLAFSIAALRTRELRRHAEAALKLEREKFSKLFTSSPDWITVTSLAEGRYIDVNDAFLKITGFCREEVLGRTSLELNMRVNPRDRDQLVEALLKEGTVDNQETMLRMKSGEIRLFQRAADLITIDGERCLISVVRDITERKKAEEELKTSREQLRNLYTKLQSMREEERTYIAREIHDELGQALTALKLDLSWVYSKLHEDQESLKDKLLSDINLTDRTIQSVKRICTELRPGILDHLGIGAAIEWQAAEFQKRTGIQCNVTLSHADIVLDRDRSTAIFRIFQEALTNILRHAKATGVSSFLMLGQGKVLLEVSDNGIGMTNEQAAQSKSFGLLGMRERVYPWGGQVTISSAQNRGTTVTVRIPIDDTQRK